MEYFYKATINKGIAVSSIAVSLYSYIKYLQSTNSTDVIQINKSLMMLYAGINSDKILMNTIKTLENLNLIAYSCGKNRHLHGTITVLNDGNVKQSSTITSTFPKTSKNARNIKENQLIVASPLPSSLASFDQPTKNETVKFCDLKAIVVTKDDGQQTIKIDFQASGLNLTKQELVYADVTFNFFKVFVDTYEQNGQLRSKTLRNANFYESLKQVRLLFESDGRTIEQVREVWKFLATEDINKPFSWRVNIRSISKLREKFERLYLESQKVVQFKEMSVSDAIKKCYEATSKYYSENNSLIKI